MQKSAPESAVILGPASLKGRGTVWAMQHRFTANVHEAFDDGWGTLEQSAHE